MSEREDIYEREWLVRFVKATELLLDIGDAPSTGRVRSFIQEHARSEVAAFEEWKDEELSRFETETSGAVRPQPDAVDQAPSPAALSQEDTKA